MQAINQESQMTITTFLRALLELSNAKKKQIDHSLKIDKDNQFLTLVADANTPPVWLETDQVMLTRMRKAMEENGVPYMQFDKIGTNKGYIVFPIEYKDFVMNIEKGVRMHAGLEIDTPEELESIIKMKNSNEKLCEIKNVDTLVASRVLDMAKGKNSDYPNVTVVKDTYTQEELQNVKCDKNKKVSLYCSSSDASLVQRIIVSATLDLNSQKPDMPLVREGMHYINQQKLEIAAMLEEATQKGSAENAFIYSLKDADSYIGISKNSFSVMKGDAEIYGMSKSQNPDTYMDILKFRINEFEQPIYRLEHEVNAFKEGTDVAAILKDVESNKVKRPIDMSPSFTDIAIKQWVAKKCEDPLSGEFNIPTNKEDMEFINCKNLEAYLRGEKKSEIVETVVKYKNDYEKQFSDTVDSLGEMTIATRPILRSIDDLIKLSPEKIQLNETIEELKEHSNKNIIDNTQNVEASKSEEKIYKKEQTQEVVR